ncbi:PIN domain-containing protein [Desulfonema limicola]|uniref:PIN domain-containing protein n=1 Tax=Desulfonema limicola TaxID=45656 RepID=A0A975BD92_9BACT|nr:type II toxin-antitoxin system VapC family toxin [Desulfonema limicola]QTA83163.1 PIN domain-containing protein [Desulfonema limicola]
MTTNYIITELVALMTSPLRLQHQIIVEFINSMKLSLQVEIIHIDPVLDEQAWHLLTKRSDKEWSLVVMQKLGITESLTTDHHFEQAGFIRLLK